MARLQKKIERDIERASAREMQEMLSELLIGTDTMSEEEQKLRRQQMIQRIEAKCEELRRKIKILEQDAGGKGWDFSKEKELDTFAEDEMIFLRNCCDSEKKAYIQIKKENTDTPELYDDENAIEVTWNMFNSERSFCCSIIRKVDNKFLGYISIKDTKSNLWEMAIEMLQEHCRKGYGLRAIALFLPAVSKITDKSQFQALVETDNIPSQKLMEKSGAKLIDIYDYSFHGDEAAAIAFEEKNISEITERMVELAEQLGVEPRKMLSHVLDYRFFIQEGKILNMSREKR